jgi:2-C-methyl-D-erythritol 4-phosphate cytidylyltransferase
MSQRIALIPAAGHGSRFGTATPKQYQLLHGQPLLAHTVNVLCACAAIDRVVVVISPGDEWFDSYSWPQAKLEVLRAGGASRAQSVANGLAALAADEDDWVLVHDAARCCLSPDALQRLLDEVGDDAIGGILAQPVADTVKQGKVGRIAATVPRDNLWLAQTPQMFRAGLLAEALQDAANPAITDEASAIELLGHAPRLVVGEAQNFKVTWPGDLALAAAILAARQA